MSIATLTIDINTRLANIEKDLGRLGHSAEKSSRQLEESFGKAGAAIKGTVAGIVAGFTFDAVIGGVRGAIDSLDQLNDAADATGASIENLSALQDIAKRNGHAVDLVTDSILKLNQGLNEDAGGKTAANLKAIGLSAEELKNIDPAEAYKKVADALAKFADNGDKARLVQELFGRSAKELAPLLKDVSEAGTLQAKITTEQAEAAEKFNKNTAALSANLSYMAQVGASQVLPFLNEIFERFNRASAAGQDFSTSIARAFGVGSLNESLKNPWESLRKVNEEIDKIEGGKGGSNRAFNQRRLDRLKKDATELESVIADIDRKLADTPVDKPGVTPPASKSKVDEAKRAAAELIKRRQEAARQVSDMLAQIESGSSPEMEDALEREAKLREQNAEAVRKQVEYFKDLADPTAKYRAQLEEVAKLGRTLDAQGNPLMSAEDVQKATKAIEQQAAAMRGHKTLTEEIGLVFESSFERAATDIDKMSNAMEYARNVAQGLAQDILKMAFRKTVTEPLLGAVKGFDLGRIFGGSGGTSNSVMGVDLSGSSENVFSDGGWIDDLLSGFRANGGPVSAGKRYMVGERGPEIFVPGSSGNIVPNHALGGGVALSVNVNVTDNVGASVAVGEARMNGQGEVDLDLVLDQAGSQKMGKRGTAMNRTLRANGVRPALVER